MNHRPAEKLYSARLLALSASLARFPYLPPYMHSSQARAQTCGSTIQLGIDMGIDGAIARIGMQVSACAVGQSSAAILADDVQGRSAKDVLAARDAVASWLDGEGEALDWPGFDALLPAREYAGRHGALLLPWRAAADALSTGTATG